MSTPQPLWGLALGWPPAYLTRDADPRLARLRFLTHYGLHSTYTTLEEYAALTAPQREAERALMEAGAIRYNTRPRLDFFHPDPAVPARQVDDYLRLLSRWKDEARLCLVTVGGGDQHRFLADPPLSRQLESLQRVLAPLARGCRDLGLPLGIENHGDYYISDLVALCHATPGLGIFLDTGNTYLIGEQPLPAFEAAAPLAVGTHFKDQKVRPRPDASPLCFEVRNAAPGTGHVPLRECYRILMARAPRPAELVMELEYFPSDWNQPIAEWERVLEFVHSLQP